MTFRRIVINDEDLDLVITNQETRDLAMNVAAAFSRYKYGALAIVASSSFVFGMSRMLELSIDNERMPVAVFKTEALARAWIAEVRQLQADAQAG